MIITIQICDQFKISQLASSKEIEVVVVCQKFGGFQLINDHFDEEVDGDIDGAVDGIGETC